MSSRSLRLIGLSLIIWNLPAIAQPRPNSARLRPPQTLQHAKPSQSPFIPGRYTLILQDPAVADRFATRDAVATAAADSYRRQVEAVQARVKSEVAARNYHVLGSVSLLENAIFVAAPESAVADLESIPGVVAVKPARRMMLMLNRATTLVNAPQAWTLVGGLSNAGAGIKIGVIDSGIDQTHPALQDSSLSMPAGFPKGVASYTTNKVIVARSYANLLSTTDPTTSTPDDFSPRDRIGHGTFNAIIAAGNTTTTPAISTSGGAISINGMAPKAWLGNYKVEGSPGVDEFASDQTMIQAVNDAVSDGMDVITCSIGGPAISDAASDPVAAAFEKATQFAVVVASAGDSGADSIDVWGFYYPGFNTIGSPSNAPDVISVGATLNSHVLLPTVTVNASGAPSNLQGISALVGDSYYFPSMFGANQAPLIDVATLGNDGTACAALPVNSLYDDFALILQGSCDYDTQALNAQNAGAIGYIYYASASGTLVFPEGINEYGASVMISNSAGVALKTYIDAHPGAMVTIDLNGQEQDVSTYSSLYAFSPPLAANQLAAYSSMGPTPDGMLKPDMVAIGGSDGNLSPDGDVPAPAGLYSGTQNYDPNYPFYVNVFSANRFAAGDGTSFSTPLVAGAAALLKQKYPNLSPLQIRSLLINYSAQNVTTDDFADPVDVEWMGAGSLDANAAINGTVTATPATISFGLLNSATLPITKTITLANISSASVTLSATVACCYANGSAGAAISPAAIAVTPTSVTIAAGATATLTVTLSGSKPAASEYSGYVKLQSSATTLHIPFMAIEGDGFLYNLLPFGGGEGAPGQDMGSSGVQLTDDYGAPVAGTGVTYSVSPRGSVTLKSVTGEPACSPASSSITVTCPSDQFGNSYVEVIAGSTPSQPNVNFSIGGNTSYFSYNIQNAPAITSVSDSVGSKSPVAPGSYLSIYGTGLSDLTDSTSCALTTICAVATYYALASNGTYTVLPLQVDYVSVSFDVPSAGISVPGRIVNYVSPTQLNVIVPWELQGQSSAQVKVVLDGDLFGNVVTVPLTVYQPVLFTYGSNIADALDPNYALITASNPAKRGSGSFVSLYANGLGPVTNQPATGDPASATNLSNTTTPVTVSIGGQTVTASFAGLAPGYQGLYQVTFTIPTAVTPGSAVPLSITVGGVTSPQATLPVQ